jgi:UDP-N-acetylglucosamine 2-epimerase (non-hydrolysing)
MERMKHILHVVGARPNFIKAAPVLRALAARKGVRQTLVHTGQHYDVNMSDIFFRQLGMPAPDVSLGVGSGSHARQTAQVLLGLEPVLLERKPDLVVVYGDVNSTMAAALAASKLHVPVAHVEAGLRSGDREMPEEINRIITDAISDLLFTPSKDGDANLRKEGVPAKKIRFVGNVMIDTLIRLLPSAKRPAAPRLDGRFVLVTLHRPANTDDARGLAALMRALTAISRLAPVVFPIHPRTRTRLEASGFRAPADGRLLLIEPLGYLEFLSLQRDAALVVTDSGGIQEETTYLGVPCLTVRTTTERPVTVTAGTNKLVRDYARLPAEAAASLKRGRKTAKPPKLWDGKAGERVADGLLAWLAQRRAA